MKNHQLGVLNVNDLRKKLQSKGLDFSAPCIVFDVCDPHRAKIILEAKIDISMALPCRISIYENDLPVVDS